jgi:hypothetical protein
MAGAPLSSDGASSGGRWARASSAVQDRLFASRFVQQYVALLHKNGESSCVRVVRAASLWVCALALHARCAVPQHSQTLQRVGRSCAAVTRASCFHMQTCVVID